MPRKIIKKSFTLLLLAIVCAFAPLSSAQAAWTEVIDNYIIYEHPDITIHPETISVSKKSVNQYDAVKISVKVTKDNDTPIKVWFYMSEPEESNHFGAVQGTKEGDYYYIYVTANYPGEYRLQEIVATDQYAGGKAIAGFPLSESTYEGGIYDPANMDRATFSVVGKSSYGNFTGMVIDNGAWRYVENGTVDYNYTGMANNEYGWWYFRNGQLDWNYTGMACNEYGWWYFRNGQLDWNYTGMACNEYGWWYYRNGNLDWNYTGMACNEYGWWYYQNGRLNWNYTGMACNEYGWWYYQNGRLDWNYTGMACNEYGWWYYQNGRLNWNYTGLGYNEYGAWLYNNGSIDWDYTGEWYGYNVVNGHVQ